MNDKPAKIEMVTLKLLCAELSALQIPNLEGAGSNPAGVTSRTFYCERSLTFR